MLQLHRHLALFSPATGTRACAAGFLVSLLTVPVTASVDRLLSLSGAPAAPVAITPELVAGLVVGGLLIAPALETALLQSCIIENIGVESRRRRMAMAASTLLFAAAHGFSNGIRGVVVMAPMGCMLACAYCWARRHSARAAFVTTWATHTFHNAINVGLGLAFPHLA